MGFILNPYAHVPFVQPPVWAIEDFSYDTVSLVVGDKEINPQAVIFNDDGSKVYITGNSGAGRKIHEYSCAINYSLVGASFLQTTFNFGTQSPSEPNPTAIRFKPGGLKAYAVGITNNTFYQYTLTTPYDTSTMTKDASSFNAASIDNLILGFDISPDGTKLLFTGLQHTKIYSLTFDTPWDISTLSDDAKSFNYATEDTVQQELQLHPNGFSLYTTGSTNDRVYRYLMSSKNDPSTITPDGFISVSSNSNNEPRGMIITPDGQRMIVVNDKAGATSALDQYSIV